MRKGPSDGVWTWLLSAVFFFALVILYFLWAKFSGRPATVPPLPAPDPAPITEPAASPLPTAPIRMKIKRIEPRKYRREGELPPPPSVR